MDEETGEKSFRLDVMVAASGFKNKDQQALEEASGRLSAQVPNLNAVIQIVHAGSRRPR